MSQLAPTAKPTVRPPYDAAYQVASGTGLDWEALRQYTDIANIDTVRTAFPSLLHRDVEVPAIKGLDDNTITLTIFESKAVNKTDRPAILVVHGGFPISRMWS
jgi:hypothetical protein